MTELRRRKRSDGLRNRTADIRWDGKLCLCDQRDGQVFMTLDCKIPTARGFQVVTDEITRVSVENPLKRCHVGHTTIFHRPLPSSVLLRKLTIVKAFILEKLWTAGAESGLRKQEKKSPV